jgi:hypothetical protein
LARRGHEVEVWRWSDWDPVAERYELAYERARGSRERVSQ